MTKKVTIYICGLILLGLGVALILNSETGAGSWDALYANLVVQFNSSFKIIQVLVTLIVLPIGLLMQGKKIFVISSIFPILISFFVGFWVDIFLPIIPLSSSFSNPLIIQIIYIFLALNIIGFGLNLVLYPKFPIPSIDELTRGINIKLKISFGLSKILTEIIALTFAFSIYSIFALEKSNIGIGTLVISLTLGLFINLYKNIFDKLIKNKT